MNQNNNYNFDPMTGQPVNQTSNYQQPQPTQPQMNTNYYQQPLDSPQKNKNNKIVIIIVLVTIIVIAAIIIFLNNRDKSPMNNEINNEINDNVEINTNVDVENNTEQQDNNINDNIEEEINNNPITSDNFLLSIEEVFTVAGRGTVVRGKIERGEITLNDELEIIGLKDTQKTVIIGLETYDRIAIDYAKEGDAVGILIKDIERNEVQIGQVLATPKSITASSKFDANVHMLTKEEGGRHTPFLNGYSAQFKIRTANVKGTVSLPDNIEIVSPGEDVSFTTTLTSSVAIEIGTQFSIMEDDKVVGTGTVTKVY